MNFEVLLPTEICFGAGRFTEVGQHASACGKHAFVLTGSREEPAATLEKLLRDAGVGATLHRVTGEPTTKTVEEAAQKARKEACDFVIGLGGGSVIDTGKAVAALMTNRGELLEYLEVIGEGQPLKKAPAPYIAIPTTAGTGSEVTKNAVLGSPEHRVKVSMRSPLMCPDIALLDPELTYDLPPAQTAASGIDALVQVIEPFLSHKATPFTDALCREAIAKGARSIRSAVEDGSDLEARSDMMLTALFSGVALANAKLGVVHGIAGPLGGYAPEAAPHGAVCARLLPYALEANYRHADEGTILRKRFDELGGLLTQQRDATGEDAIEWAKRLIDDLEVPGLSNYGLNEADLVALAEKAQNASSMKGNPVKLSAAEIEGIIRQAL